MVGCAGVSALAALALAVAFALTPHLFDVGQCRRACSLHFRGAMFPHPGAGGTVRGDWLRFTGPDLCMCFEEQPDGLSVAALGKVRRKYAAVAPGYPYVWENSQVCGEDGVEYTSAEAAAAAGAKVVNCGPCGQCSNVADVSLFRALGASLVQKVGTCIVGYMFGTAGVEGACLRALGFSEGCADCWVEDHGCLLSHCFYDCVLKLDTYATALQASWKGTNDDEEKGGCLHCMETLCSKPYIDSCGANRRTAGLLSDIQRNSKEICKAANVLT